MFMKYWKSLYVSGVLTVEGFPAKAPRKFKSCLGILYASSLFAVLSEASEVRNVLSTFTNGLVHSMTDTAEDLAGDFTELSGHLQWRRFLLQPPQTVRFSSHFFLRVLPASQVLVIISIELADTYKLDSLSSSLASVGLALLALL